MQLAQSHSTGRSIIASLALAGIIGVMAVGPVAADTELGHTGQVGQHSLRDADIYHPGATCRYKTVSESSRHWEGLLKRIDVRPPRVRSVGSHQRVGWRFVVQRSYLYGEPVWRTTYRSSVQTATAYSGANASFVVMSVPVSVPADSWDDPYIYRVRVKTIWYRSGGSVQGRASHGVDYYAQTVDGEPGGAEWDNCVGHPNWHGDGP
jgi:hypothetical protein